MIRAAAALAFAVAAWPAMAQQAEAPPPQPAAESGSEGADDSMASFDLGALPSAPQARPDDRTDMTGIPGLRDVARAQNDRTLEERAAQQEQAARDEQARQAGLATVEGEPAGASPGNCVETATGFRCTRTVVRGSSEESRQRAQRALDSVLGDD